MLTILRYGELCASNFTLGPWGEQTRSALGCRPLIEGNPYIIEKTPVYAALQVKGKTAAYVFLYPDQFCWAAPDLRAPINWLWMTDYLSLPAYRNSGAGVLLIKHLRTQLEAEGYCLGGINLSADSRRVFEALRFPVVEKIPRYVFPLRSRPILSRYPLLRPILPLACPAANLALRLYCHHAVWRVRGPHITLTLDHSPSTIQCPLSTVHSSTEPISLRALESSWFKKTEPIGAFDKSPRRMHWFLNLPPGGGRTLQPWLLHADDSPDPIGSLLLRSKRFNSIAGGRFRNLRILSVLEADGLDPAQLVRAVLQRATREAPPPDVIEWCEDRPVVQACLQRAGFRKMGAMAFCSSLPLPTPRHITQGDGDAGL